MPAKAPIYLKQSNGKEGNGGGKGAKKLREILSTEMISPPLGDFRHMAHVGRGGKDDMFGDTTFLQKKVADNTSSTTTTKNTQGVPTFHSFRRKGTGKASKKSRNSSAIDTDNSEESSPIFNQTQNGYGPAQSPILKTAFSLPIPNQQSSSAPTTPVHNISKDTKKENNNSKSISKNTLTEKHTSSPSTKSLQTSNGHVQTTANGISNHYPPKKQSITHFGDTTSIDESWSLELDLGTSLMDDVMGVLDKIEL